MESCLEWGQAPGITSPALQRTELASVASVSLRAQEASCGHIPGGHVLEGSFPLQPDWNQGWGEGPWCGTQNISYASPWGYYDWVNLCKMPRIIPDLVRLCCDDCNMPGASLALWVCPHEICLQFTKHALFMCQNSDYCHCSSPSVRRLLDPMSMGCLGMGRWHGPVHMLTLFVSLFHCVPCAQIQKKVCELRFES